MKNKSTHLESINGFLSSFTGQQGWNEQLDLHSVFLRWNDLVDSDIANHCQPLKIVKNVLWIEVENSAWLQQLQFQTIPLLIILNKSFRSSKLEGLRFCLAANEKTEKEEKEISLRYVQPPVQDVEAFEKQAEAILDKDSREALLRLWYLSQACKKE